MRGVAVKDLHDAVGVKDRSDKSGLEGTGMEIQNGILFAKRLPKLEDEVSPGDARAKALADLGVAVAREARLRFYAGASLTA
jgi:hypothetical protein